MVNFAGKIHIPAIIVCAAIMLTPFSAIAAPNKQPTAKPLQPQALNYAGLYQLRQLEPTLTGSGVKFAIISRSFTYTDGKPQNDYRPNIEHDCFTNKQFNFNDQNELPPGISPHSTAVCSILLGEDPNAFNQDVGQFSYQGAAPQAQADIYEFWHFLINNVFPHSPPDADILTASFGTQFEDWWTRGIEAMAEHHGLIVVAGIGNGLEAYDPLLYPGAAANAIGVGVVNSLNTDNIQTNLQSFSLAYPQHSSFGPTTDARCKPDIVTAGNCLAAATEPNGYEPTGSWSSFSTPLVAGTIGLLVQKAKLDPDLSPALDPNGGNCLIKAILLNSATKLPFWHKGLLKTDDDHSIPLDYVQGAGMLNATAAYRHLTAGQSRPGSAPTTGWDLNLLQENQTAKNIYEITLTEPADKFITATIAWNKHYSSVYPFEPIPEKDANLRLEIWAVDSNDPESNYLLDYSDSNTDNLEHIYCRADANYTNYEIIVTYSGISDHLTQRYGLAWNAESSQDNDSSFLYDLNTDGDINDSDSDILLNNWLLSVISPDAYLMGDINSDGAIDIKDWQILEIRKIAEQPGK